MRSLPPFSTQPPKRYTESNRGSQSCQCAPDARVIEATATHPRPFGVDAVLGERVVGVVHGNDVWVYDGFTKRETGPLRRVGSKEGQDHERLAVSQDTAEEDEMAKPTLGAKRTRTSLANTPTRCPRGLPSPLSIIGSTWQPLVRRHQRWTTATVN